MQRMHRRNIIINEIVQNLYGDARKFLSPCKEIFMAIEKNFYGDRKFYQSLITNSRILIVIKYIHNEIQSY